MTVLTITASAMINAMATAAPASLPATIPAPAPAPAATTSAPATRLALDHSSPKNLLRSVFRSGGDLDEASLRMLFHAPTPAEQELVDATVKIAVASERLRAAEIERFGRAAAATV